MFIDYLARQVALALAPSLSALHTKVELALSKLDALKQQGAAMSGEMQQLIEQVKRNTDVEASAVIAIQGAAQKLSDVVAQLAASAEDKAKMLEAIDQLKASAAPLAAAIAANTQPA